MLNKLRGSRGATMPELIAAIVILGIGIALFATQMSSNAKLASSFEKELAFSDLVGQVQLFSSSPAMCTTVMLGVKPVTGDPLVINLSGMNLGAGLLFQNDQLKITELKWTLIKPISTTETVGFISLQADLGINGFTGAGGSLRNYPQAGTNPPGIMVDMATDPITGVITKCGPSAASAVDGITERFSFVVNVDLNDSEDRSGTQMLPAPFVDNNYTLVCNKTNPNIGTGAGGKNMGAITIISLSPASFFWHYWQYVGDWIPNTAIVVNCVAHHP